MSLSRLAEPEVAPGLLDAIASFPLTRDVEHCGVRFQVSPLDIYALCPACGTRLKVRSFTAGTELEDVFDAVLTWMAQPGATELARQRQRELLSDEE